MIVFGILSNLFLESRPYYSKLNQIINTIIPLNNFEYTPQQTTK